MPKLLFCCLLLPVFAYAGQVLSLTVNRSHKLYQVNLTANIHAPAAKLRQILNDYRNWPRISSPIKSSLLLPSPQPGIQRVKSKLKGCILWFCMNSTHVQDIQTLKNGDIHAQVVPTLSDFKFGQSLWRIKAYGQSNQHSQLTLLLQIQPNFWIPPLVGPWLVKRKLQQETLQTITNLEALIKP